MNPRSLLLVFVALIALVALAQNQPSPDQRIKQLEDKVTSLQDRLQKLESLSMGAGSTSLMLGDALLPLREFQNKIVVLNQQRSDLLRTYTPGHPVVVTLDHQIGFLKSQFGEVARQIENSK